MMLPPTSDQVLLGWAYKHEKELFCLLAQPLARTYSAWLRDINKAVEREKKRERERAKGRKREGEKESKTEGDKQKSKEVLNMIVVKFTIMKN